MTRFYFPRSMLLNFSCNIDKLPTVAVGTVGSEMVPQGECSTAR